MLPVPPDAAAGSSALRWAFTALTLALAVLFAAVVRWSALRAGLGRAAAGRQGLAAAAAAALWIALTGALAARGALHFEAPPTMLPVVPVVIALAVGIVLSPLGRRLAMSLPLAALVGYQGFRVAVELLMHRAYSEGLMPVQMSYAGRNFDIVTGITAIAVGAWLAVRGNQASRRLVLAWNTLGAALLANILVVALLSAPTPMRAFFNEPANTWVTHAPWVWLPTGDGARRDHRPCAGLSPAAGGVAGRGTIAPRRRPGEIPGMPDQFDRATIVNVGYRSTNFWVVSAGTSRLLVDLGWPGSMGTMRANLGRMGVPLQEIRYGLATHYHIDHAGVAQELKQEGVRLLVLDTQVEAIPLLKSWVKPRDQYVEITLHDNVTISFAESRAVLAGIGIAGEIVSTPGHSDDSVSLLLDDGSAFTGDLTHPSLAGEGDAAVVAASWTLLRDRGATRVYPGHGPVRPMPPVPVA